MVSVDESSKYLVYLNYHKVKGDTKNERSKKKKRRDF